ncbi:MAG: nickel pincer cofactor biosynthesis protein LarB [Acidobacteria bacterium]|nr:nickel pincer cofactor biosynthesis protein LarB [Acidobacteriota bacterium]MCG2814354.1 nickel pincer cofactor biosynthesis protein LarB [Candidatus Aminicenantes bacterium]MBU1339607.1 nickel pincer cofactor biosynthesis protein LarB [Acidobacteriota bacterium]MBU1474318.1 nickel pincer cofactor biosynthesis protein LarB [Acidobacteriota bacterium]MBU4203053.1 nickel pincer cofactor biosynthesis protein LarB [Acidobacteriota bacterium]
MKDKLVSILNQVKSGTLSPEDAYTELKDLPYQDLHFAKIDHHREIRRGQPEIVYGLGKTDEQIEIIARAILEKGSNLLVTRTGPAVHDALKKDFPDIQYNAPARAVFLKHDKPAGGKGKIAIITAGTSDIPVAEEANVTCDILGNETDRLFDVGVAGIHRLFGELDRIRSARVIICVAGMEGALPSVIAGVTDVPVIAVPTSVGYGASLNGLAALLTMLNSCSGGIGVVNIDNGFGAGFLASLINHL